MYISLVYVTWILWHIVFKHIDRRVVLSNLQVSDLEGNLWGTKKAGLLTDTMDLFAYSLPPLVSRPLLKATIAQAGEYLDALSTYANLTSPPQGSLLGVGG